MGNSRYTFGTTETAAKRLEEMAVFFNPQAKEWLRKFTKSPVKTAIDLGCGPGFSTDMLYDAVKPETVCGIESSAGFIEMAKNRFPKYAFLKHDLAQGSLPVKADVMYCRFLLSHIREAGALVNMWLEASAPGGTFFMDEVEGINTDIPVFKRYLEINEGLVRSQGAELYIGEALSRMKFNARVISSELVPVPVASWRAAAWFYPNTVTIWEKEKYVRDNFPAELRQKISSEIKDIRDKRDVSVKSLWKMRRIVVKKNN